MKNSVKLGVTLLGGSLLAVYGGADASAKEGEVKVQLQGINDLHGQLDGYGSVYEYGKKHKEKGGTASLLGTYLDNSEKEFKDSNVEDGVTLRVQAGDMVGASQAISGILQDEPTMKSLKKLNFELGTIGNHEFDEGLEEFNRILVGEAPKQGEFNKAVDEYPRENTNMEITIANVTNKEDGKVPFNWPPYLVKTLVDSEGEEAKIGFIGVVTEEIPTLVLKKQWEKYNVTDPADAINKYSKELRKQGVNAIVVLAHAAASSAKDNDTDVQGEVRKIIDRLDSDSSVDIIFAGHNHVITNAVYKGIRVVEGASHGKAFADVIGTYNVKNKDFSDVTAKVTPVLAKEGVKPREDLVAIAKDAEDRIKEIVEAKVTTADTTVVRSIDFPEGTPEYKKSPANLESPVGNLITDAQLKAAREAGFKADFAITNNGGIRAHLEITKEGVVTWGSAQKVQPFGNVMQVVEISGKNLIATLNSQYNSEEKYFLQMSGIGYTYKEAPEGTEDEKGKPVKWVVDKAWVEKDGKKILIKEDSTYVGVINDFLYGGGDDFPELRGPENTKLLGALDPDTEIFVKYLKSFEKIAIPELGRKIYYKDLQDTILTEEEKSNESTVEKDSKTSSSVLGIEIKENEHNESKDSDSKLEEKEITISSEIKKQSKELNVSKTKKDASETKKLPNTGQTTSNYTLFGVFAIIGLLGLRRKLKR
ncbi:5'-nucleotidase C-terminal domain-containing protein [Gemelliphila palaticanis]|uniref:5'-nucleotidase C-terminal domain-containing protein n=1 Tax=Gemelliphila palaticanis TaxID=81950 RepID=A0ABX2T534_9BACL|nr:5'-nucleotidase C-terminal domain-containing protein [Gemella palaticanis]MBF0716186.1 5'-nucleotidase C-terminal domain-containing protein [Gemella palaticanis]NYS48116.1 5'-nucleotidase C-terminal domain-containing protein [Gemella palaticanis]